MSLIIGFGNKARHGKDSAANAIIQHTVNQALDRAYNTFFRPTITCSFKFAETLYEECRVLHGMTEKDAPLLQKVGMARRAEHPLYWVERTFQKIDDFFKEHSQGVALVTDVRFQNEAIEIKRRGGYLVNVSRLNADGTLFIANDRPADHPSETELDDFNWDFRIETKTGQEDLAGKLAIATFDYIRRIRENN